MLSQDKKEKFVKMCDENYGFIIGTDDVVETRDTIDGFIDKYGIGTDYDGLRVWENIQRNGKGTERGDLMVVEFDGVCAAYFG